MAAFPLVGLSLGLILGLAWELPLIGAFLHERPWVGALWFVFANLWLTRGLHMDGVADVADAWGSGARGERFREILKDSRLGAFGAMGIVLALAGYLIFGAEVLTKGGWPVLAYALVQGRFLAVALAYVGRDLLHPGLAQTFAAGDTPNAALRNLAWAGGWTLLTGMILTSPLAVLSALLAGVLSLWPVYVLAWREGLSGDFLGLAVVLGELAALLGWLAAA
jgi:adenosylcobinamide-GDP ribazoletransferase